MNTLAQPPIKLRRYTLLLGNVGRDELAIALAESPNSLPIQLHIHGVQIACDWLGNELPAWELCKKIELKCGLTIQDFTEALDGKLTSLLGDDYAARGFINSSSDDEDEEYIIADATLADVKCFIAEYGEDEVLVIETGPMQKASCKHCVWLPSPELSERLKLLRRELGTL